MGDVRLVLPSSEYKGSFLEALREFQEEGRYTDLDLKELEEDFDTYVHKFLRAAVEPEEGKVPDTYFWLVDGDEVIGRVSIRHTLNEKLRSVGGHIGYDIRPSKRRLGYGTKLLALALPEAKKLGIDSALVTCDVTNIGSRKIIEANGGVLEDEVPGEEGEPNKLRFWIETDRRVN